MRQLEFAAHLAGRIALATLAILAVATAPPESATRARADDMAGPDASRTPLTARDSALIVLNRLAYGPRPGDVDRVASMGVMRWVDQQLAAPHDRARAQIESQFSILRLDRQDLARKFIEARDARRADKADSMTMSSDPTLREYRDLAEQFQQLVVARAVTADNQLEEVLADFWINHFNVFFGKNTDRFLLPSYVEQTVRPRVLGKFEDLLIATAESPAMMVYLDNTLSVAKGAIPPQLERAEMREMRGYSSMSEEQIERIKSRMPTGINENYARELFELHTLGVDGGYTQHDVQEAARILTGWGVDPPEKGGGFVFRDWAHDDGEKEVLGVRFKAGHGRDEGVKLLRMLARHPATMQHVTTQLCERLISDDPPAGAIEAGVAAWKRSDGSIREVVRAILSSPEFWAEARSRTKFKTPLEFVASSVRAVDGTVGVEPGPARAVARLGQPLYQQPVPTGYADTEAAWANSAALFERMNVAVALAAGRMPGVSVDLDPLVETTGDADALLQRVDQALFSGQLSSHTEEVIRRQIEGLNPPQARAMAVGLGLGGPDFQHQ
ncbi:MAG TPA: DUF1800 domain-containing protein [Candidatus Sulfotelmatobacter sp.]|nr:DUF1800 domain-containing protein [Candidatus Sulfotelmatobacter sp.]